MNMHIKITHGDTGFIACRVGLPNLFGRGKTVIKAIADLLTSQEDVLEIDNGTITVEIEHAKKKKKSRR